MQSQLEDVVDRVSGFLLYALQRVHIPGVQHQWFFANHITTQAQRVARVRIVQVVGRAHGDNVYFLVRILDFGAVAVEQLLFCKEVGIRKITVDDAHAVADVIRGNQVVAGVLDGFQMLGRHITAYSDNGEILHAFGSVSFCC